MHAAHVGRPSCSLHVPLLLPRQADLYRTGLEKRVASLEEAVKSFQAPAPELAVVVATPSAPEEPQE